MRHGMKRFVALAGCALVIGACGGNSPIGSPAEAADVVKRELRDCGSPGRVECTARRGGWECTFGVTEDGYRGTAFVSSDGGNVHVLSLC